MSQEFPPTGPEKSPEEKPEGDLATPREVSASEQPEQSAESQKPETPLAPEKEENLEKAAERIAQADSFDELYVVLRELRKVETSQGKQTAEDIIETIEKIRNGELPFQDESRFHVTRGGSLKIRQRVAYLLAKEGEKEPPPPPNPETPKAPEQHDAEQLRAEAKKTLKDIVEGLPGFADGARERLAELAKSAEGKQAIADLQSEIKQELEAAQAAIQENKGVDRLGAREALKQATIEKEQLEAELKILEEFVGAAPKAEKLKKEKEEKEEEKPVDVGELIYGGFEKTFSIKKEGLESIEGFKDLSDGQKMLVLRNLKQVALGRVQDEASRKFGEETGQAGVLGRMWRNVLRKYYITKGEKGETQELAAGGIAMHGRMLEELAKQTKESGLDVAVAEDGELKINFVGEEFERMTDAQKEIVRTFNVAAIKFTSTPQEWASGYASRKEKADYQKARSAYEKAKADLLVVEKVHCGNDVQAQLAVLDIERKVQMQQLLSAHPEIESQLSRLASRSVWVRAFGNIFAERGSYMALGYVTRTATMSAVGLIGLPIAAAAMGGLMAWRRGREAIKTEGRAIRGGKGEELLAQAMEKRRGAFERHQEVFKRKQGEVFGEPDVVAAKGRLDAAWKESGGTLNEWREKLTADPGLQEADKKLREAQEKISSDTDVAAAKKEMDAAAGEVEAAKRKMYGKGRRSYESAGTLAHKLEGMVQELQTGRSPEGRELSDEQKKNLARRLKERIAYTQGKMEKGLVIFGKPEERIANTYSLLTQISTAACEVAGREREGEIMPNVKVFEKLERGAKREERKEQRRLLRQTIQGALFGAAFATAGWAIRDYFHEDVSILKGQGEPVTVALEHQAHLFEQEIGVDSRDGLSPAEAIILHDALHGPGDEGAKQIAEFYTKNFPLDSLVNRGNAIIHQLTSAETMRPAEMKNLVNESLGIDEVKGYTVENAERVEQFLNTVAERNPKLLSTVGEVKALYRQVSTLGWEQAAAGTTYRPPQVIQPKGPELGAVAARPSSTDVVQPRGPALGKPATPATQEVVDSLLGKKPTPPVAEEHAATTAAGAYRPPREIPRSDYLGTGYTREELARQLETQQARGGVPQEMPPARVPAPEAAGAAGKGIAEQAGQVKPPVETGRPAGPAGAAAEKPLTPAVQAGEPGAHEAAAAAKPVAAELPEEARPAATPQHPAEEAARGAAEHLPSARGIEYVESLRGSTDTKFIDAEVVKKGEGISQVLYRILANKAIERPHDFELEPADLTDKKKVMTAVGRQMMRMLRENDVVDESGKTLGKAMDATREIRIRDIGGRVALSEDGKTITVHAETYTVPPGRMEYVVPVKSVPIPQATVPESPAALKVPEAGVVETVPRTSATSTAEAMRDELARERVAGAKPAAVGMEQAAADTSGAPRPAQPIVEHAAVVEAAPAGGRPAAPDSAKVQYERLRVETEGGVLSKESQNIVRNLQRELNEGRGWFSFGGPDREDLERITAQFAQSVSRQFEGLQGFGEEEGRLFVASLGQGKSISAETFNQFMKGGRLDEGLLVRRLTYFHGLLRGGMRDLPQEWFPRIIHVGDREVKALIQQTSEDPNIFSYLTLDGQRGTGVRTDLLPRPILPRTR